MHHHVTGGQPPQQRAGGFPRAHRVFAALHRFLQPALLGEEGKPPRIHHFRLSEEIQNGIESHARTHQQRRLAGQRQRLIRPALHVQRDRDEKRHADDDDNRWNKQDGLVH